MSEHVPPSFAELGLDDRLVSALDALGFEAPTPIQEAAIPVVLRGCDMIGQARTGSGKTAAFGLALLERAKTGGAPARALVLTPTRELAQQVARAIEDFAAHLPVSVATIYGGTPYPPQLAALETATVVVGTPGRLRDHLERGTLDLSQLEVFVMDEGDRMLQMGFLEDLERLLGVTPAQRQMLMFSATMSGAVRRLASLYLRDPVRVEVEDKTHTVEHITQSWTLVPRAHTLEALALVLRGVERDTAVVFCQTKVGTAEVGDTLARQGFAAACLHGDMSQPARESVLQKVRDGEVDVLVATDVASRGLDIDHISHVINLEMPPTLEAYVHRIGRTGRVGRPGTALTFATSKGKRHLHALAATLDNPIEPVDLPIPEGTPPPTWSRPASAFGRPPPQRADNVNEMRLVCTVGRRHRVRISDLVGLLTKEAGVRGLDIGRVEILERHSLIGVSCEVGARILSQFPTGTIHDRDVHFSAETTDAD